MTERIREEISNYALKFLEKGRADWDAPHTLAVVHYAEKLALATGQDVLVLKTAAWLHDIGYYGSFGEGESNVLAEVKDRKTMHMIVGAQMAREILESEQLEGIYTSEQIDRIVHLVGIHDNIEALTEIDELILMEADTLGAIDLEKVTPTYSREDGLKYIENLKKRRMPKFASDLGKQYLAELLPKSENYFLQLD